MNPPWPADLDAEDPHVRSRRIGVALETVIARSRKGTYVYVIGMIAYLALVPSRADQPGFLIATGIQLGLAILRTVLYRRMVGGRTADPDRCRKAFASLAALAMFGWDAVTVLEVYVRDLDAMAMLLVAASLVLHASGTYAYAPDLYMHGMWSRWTRAPLVLAPLLLGTREGVALATLFVIHLFYAEAQSRQLNAEFWHRVIATESLAAAHVELRRETEIRQRAEIELRLAQKLESVGRLATGIAHEINTPLQAMLGSLDFIGEGVRDLIDITRAYEAALPATIRATLAPDIARELDYLVENLPESLALANDCLDRTATIVRSVKTFAHPSATAKAQVDLNHALVTTLAVARHACDGVADIVTELDDLPLVDGYAGELNQVFLNLIVNAVDAMAPLAEATGRRGTLTLTTRREGDHVCIAFADTGVGIPDRIKDSIFDPFFTTKAPGKGTGQGLMIAHTVVHQRHGGELTFASTVGRGTTFTVRLPVALPAFARDAA